MICVIHILDDVALLNGDQLRLIFVVSGNAFP